MKIAVLAGGISTERDVSLISGSQIYKALKDRHEVILLDAYLGYEGEDYQEVFSMDKDWTEGISAISKADPDLSLIRAKRKDNPNVFFGPHVIDICRHADIVFLALHGENGENGKLQAAFDLFDIKYTGTDYISSAIAMNKALTKEKFAYYHIPTPACRIVHGEEKLPQVEFPCVVKICSGGSSVGVYIANNEEEYASAMKDARSYDTEILIESYIKGREFTVCVIDGQALPVVEIAPKEGFYDYKNKYQAGSTVETCPAPLSREKTKEIQDIAVRAFWALGLKTYTRFDFMMDEKERFYCLEGNTLPGMTPISLIPQEARAIGVEFPELCEWIIKVSLEKYQGR